MKRRNLMIAALLAGSIGVLGSAVAQGNGPEGGQGMRGGMMQGGMGPGSMGPGGMGPGGMGGMGPGGKMQGRGRMDPSARVEQRLARLKADIKPTGQQEPLWQAFADKSKAEATKEGEAMRKRMSDDKPMAAPERLAQMQAAMKDRLTAMEGVNESFNRLYAALTAEQKAAADRHFGGMGRMQGVGRGGQTPPPQAPAESHKH